MTTTIHFWSAESLYEKLKSIDVDNPLCQYTLKRCERLTPQINKILQLKEEKNAIILAHSYVHPDILYGIADHVGDSYGLSLQAIQTNSSTIVFPAVRFMAETAKILNPEKLIIDPNPNGGCSLSDSITADEVLKLKEQYPKHAFFCYINTTAAVKAACDVCVTSSNVYKIVENYPSDKIFFLPDKLMGLNIRAHLQERGIQKQVLIYDGTCYVHEQFTPNQVDFIKESKPNTVVLAHPECKPDVLKKADYVGSTSMLANYVEKHANIKNHFLLLTECGLTSRLQIEVPQAKMAGTCMLCKYMKSNSLEEIARAMENPTPLDIVEIDEETRLQAKKSLDAMFQFS